MFSAVGGSLTTIERVGCTEPCGPAALRVTVAATAGLAMAATAPTPTAAAPAIIARRPCPGRDWPEPSVPSAADPVIGSELTWSLTTFSFGGGLVARPDRTLMAER